MTNYININLNILENLSKAKGHIDTIVINKEFATHEEKINIQLLKLEQLILNEIRINLYSDITKDEIVYDRYYLIDMYSIIDKAHFSNLKRLNVTNISKLFIQYGIAVDVEFKNNCIFVRYEILDLDSADKILVSGNNGVADIPVEEWKLVTKATVLNGYVHLIMWSNIGSAVKYVNFLDQYLEITGADNSHAKRSLDTLTKNLNKIGVVATIEKNSKQNYNGARVKIVRENSKNIQMKLRVLIENEMHY